MREVIFLREVSDLFKELWNNLTDLLYKVHHDVQAYINQRRIKENSIDNVFC